MSPRPHHPLAKPARRLALLALALAASLLPRAESSAGGARRLDGHVPKKLIAKARHLGRHDRAARLELAVALKPRDPEGLADLIERLHDPTDPQYRQFLSPAQFKERYAPSEEDVGKVSRYLAARGLRVTRVHDNNLLLNVEGSSGAVEEAFQTEIHSFSAPDGRRVHAPTSEPLLTDEVASRVTAVTGLSNIPLLRHARARSATTATRLGPAGLLDSRASNASSFTPAMVRRAYGLDSVTDVNGSGETVALFQLDGYDPNDIKTFATQFSLPLPTLVNVYVDGVSGAAGVDSLEVCLDIQLVMAIAPGVSKIIVYEGPNTETGVVNTYSRIASDNLAKQVSSSWGLPEDLSPVSMRNAENAIFQQMAAQGQSIFVASGDYGAYDDEDRPSTLEVDDPASQPYVTAVGGTTLTADLSGNYLSETSWGTSSTRLGGGGGVSTIWSLPSYQKSLATAANKGSTTRRMVPDVALNSNPSTGYIVRNAGSWWIVGGTSAAAPLWAGFTAIVNQKRAASGLGRLGFANPAIYQLGQSSAYASSFNDIADGSTNLYYPAVAGYDLSTGWGTIKGPGLLAALANAVLPPYPPASINVTSGAGKVFVSWSSASGATSYNLLRATSINGTYSIIQSGITATSHTDEVATGDYYYLVTATNSAGTSGASPKAGGSPSLTAPGAPSGLTATAVQ